MKTSIAALLAALAVALGAFGAHALKARLPPDLLAVWTTASQYHLVHAVALVALASGRKAPGRSWNVLLAGIVLFAGSLYLLALTGIRGLGAITPIGGVLLVAGWILLSREAWISRSRTESGA
ncbi:MAG TPA: DUF423 domain-containing protein [Fibrobacteria bacterium]|nr:DUF423 domain-containing protein [Fibrobacteria bacterium]